MIELTEESFEKLKKDADDNKQLVKIFITLAFIFVFLMVFIFWGKDMLELSVYRHRSELDRQIAIEQAENNVRIREIEQGDLSMDDYIKWLNARK